MSKTRDSPPREFTRCRTRYTATSCSIGRGKEELLKQITILLRNLGEADVPILGYQWNPRGVVSMRTTPVELRGGAVGTALDLFEIEKPDELAPGIDREYTEAKCWANFREFIETVFPVAEGAGVDMALHPIDLPVLELLCGISRLYRSIENFEKPIDLVL